MATSLAMTNQLVQPFSKDLRVEEAFPRWHSVLYRRRAQPGGQHNGRKISDDQREEPTAAVEEKPICALPVNEP